MDDRDYDDRGRDRDRDRQRSRPAAPPPRRPRFVAGKVALAVASLVVLSATGIGWDKYNEIVSGYTTADVIDPGAGGPKPADGATDVLLVGLDSRVDAQGHPLSKELLARLNAGVADGPLNTDTLILMRIPNDGSKAVGISIPRDSYVNIAGGFGKHKINSAYARGKAAATARLKKQGVTDPAQLEVKSSQEGAQILIKTIQDLTGATIDHYSEVNLLGFADITDAVGGADVCLLKPAKDSFSGANFPAGPQTLAGPQALAFVRQRHNLPNGDLDRIVRQQVFMKGMASKVLSAGTLTDSKKLDSLLAAIKKSVVLDPRWNIVDFARQMSGMTAGQLDFKTIPTGRPDLKTPEDGDAIQINTADVKTFVQGLLPGVGQPATSGSQSPSSSASSNPDTPGNGITVDVRNGNGGSGLAAQVLKDLTSQGYKEGTTLNASVRSKTVVRYAKGEKANADKVVDALGKDYTVEQDTSVPKGHVVVYLGKDYKSSQGLAGEPLLQMNPPALRAQPPGAQIGANGAPCVN
ncbi:LCP family protein [Actinocrispum sp. NPDC049592]|uniref:LCP family protein n=1 Tax=Actinocrispum sp. NPDC049592 TaxID=3154835 RepID=UPI00341285AA